jgi:hypothetical protein
VKLRAGDEVRIKSEGDILATLDHRGRRNGLPFMPEALQFCGTVARVRARAHKTCDTVSGDAKGLRRLERAVHLDDLRCDGTAHGGCQAACLLFWHEDWLDRVDASGVPRDGLHDEAVMSRSAGSASGCTRETLYVATQQHDTESADGPRYSCQATELYAATSHLPWWDLRQYWHDLTSRNVGIWRLLRGLSILAFNKIQAANAKLVPRFRFIKGGRKYPFVEGRVKRTPRATLDLRPGEWVTVRPLHEVEVTLDAGRRNRGLTFDREMVPYCGTRARVFRRAERIVDETTGRMVHLGSDCIMLENVVCRGDFHEFCPRASYPFWREIWLQRAASDQT